MAFGRSNSLSLNTSAVNNSFAAQQNQPAAQTQGNSLFGGSLFGSQAKPATTTAGTGLFGAQPAQQSTGLFGASSTAQPAANTSLFGQQPAAQPATTSLFGQSTQQPATSTSLFGAAAKPAVSNSLFGGTSFGTSQPAAQPTTSLFGGSTAPNASTAQHNSGPASLLGASRYAVGQPAPYTGRLSMGQGNAAQTSATPATKLNWDNVRPTTRFDDLVDTAKEQLEAVDAMIKQQEAFCKQIEAFLPMHGEALASLHPDIELIKDKVDTAEQALVTDAQGVQAGKLLAEKDHLDVLRCERIGENLRLPAQYHYAPAASRYGARKGKPTTAVEEVLDADYDTDLVGNYFVPMTTEMRTMLTSYQANLSDIESHLQTIEGNVLAQARSVSQARNGGSGDSDPGQQLVETLRDFEGTILTTAARVGSCREGVTELSMHRMRSGYRG